jgi:hypothetical protein
MTLETSSETRRHLLNAVTDLFLLDDEPSEASKAHYGEIASQSLTHLGASERADYAGKVAAAPTLPRNVAMQLAGDDEADVARLVLKLSPVLTDGDLAAIAVSQSQGHLVAIAERARLSSSVTDILVRRGDSTVLRTVSSNEGASFSNEGFDVLLERGGSDRAITAALSGRSDMAPERASRLLRIVEQMSDTVEGPSEQVASLARLARQQRLEVKVLISDIVAKKRTISDVVIMLVDDDRAYHATQVMAASAELTPDQVLRVMMQPDVSGLAVLCRSLGLNNTAFRAILGLRERRLPMIVHEIEDTMHDYAMLDMATADRTLRFLKMKTKVG